MVMSEEFRESNTAEPSDYILFRPSMPINCDSNSRRGCGN